MLQSLSQRVLMRLTYRRASPFNLLLWLYIYMSTSAQAQFTAAYFSAGLDNSATDLSETTACDVRCRWNQSRLRWLFNQPTAHCRVISGTQ